MTLRPEAILLVDWLNLSINLKNRRLMFGADRVSDLIKVAEELADEHGNLRLARAHFVSENFSAATEKAITQSLIGEVHRTRTVKEQADLVLAVLAMDQLHDPSGCPQLFLLATGDQDFVPLIKRIHLKGAQVVLLVAALDKLTAEYRAIAAQRNVRLIPITDVIDLGSLPKVSGVQSTTSVLGLLRVCMSGGFLGGAQDRNARLLDGWGVLTPGGDPEMEMAGLLQQFTKVEQRKVALPGRAEHGNRAGYAKRRFLDFDRAQIGEAIYDADWVLRRIGNRNHSMDAGTLGVGRFRGDNGTRLDRVLAALKAVGWLTERSDGKLESMLEWSSDGLLEPLWRVVCEIHRRTHEERTEGVSRDRLFHDLRNTPIAQVGDRRGGPAAKDVIAMARHLGIIDTVLAGTDGYALKVIESHPVSKQPVAFLKALGQLLTGRIGTFIPEYELLGLMGDEDDRSAKPVFGFDVRDRQRVLRVLRRSQLLERRSGPEAMSMLKGSAWLRKLLPAGSF
jgi:hypothetical protein